MKAYEEINFPSGSIRWIKEDNQYVCRMPEELMDDMKFIHDSKNYADYATQRAVLIDYLRVMTTRCDWHGVSDAANDLRVLEAENNNA
jgi:hypothetical protein